VILITFFLSLISNIYNGFMKIYFFFLSVFFVLYFLWDVIIRNELFVDKYYMLIFSFVSVVAFFIVKKIEDRKRKK